MSCFSCSSRSFCLCFSFSASSILFLLDGLFVLLFLLFKRDDDQVVDEVEEGVDVPEVSVDDHVPVQLAEVELRGDLFDVIYDRIDVVRHLVHRVPWIHRFEAHFWEEQFANPDVKRVCLEVLDVVHFLLDPDDAQNFIADAQDLKSMQNSLTFTYSSLFWNEDIISIYLPLLKACEPRGQTE